MLAQDETKFRQWAVVEIMGHRRFAGFVTEETIGGQAFVRVDVPESVCSNGTLPAFTKLFGSGAIYCITPCTEETARAFAAELRATAFHTYEAPRLPAPSAADDDSEDEDSEFDVFLEDEPVATNPDEPY